MVCPRAQLDQLAGRQEAKRTGVYLLVGADPDNPSRELVYIGEGDNVLARLLKHNKDEEKDFWTRAVLVLRGRDLIGRAKLPLSLLPRLGRSLALPGWISSHPLSKDDNLTKSHVRYLESRLIALPRLANRARLNNDTSPEPTPLPEPDVADMEFFLGQVQMVLPVLGFTFTQQLATLQQQAGSPGPKVVSPMFVMNPVGTSATAQEVDGEFIVFKGSTARKRGVDSWTGYRTLRDQLVSEGKLVEAGQDGLFVFTEDVPFASPSAAAAVIFAGNQNGRRVWRVKDTGETYKQWQEQKLADVDTRETAEPFNDADREDSNPGGRPGAGS